MSRENALRKRCRDLLASKDVVMVIGFRKGSRGSAQPVFVTRPEDCDSLIFDETCGPNLANYISRVKHLGRLAVVAKGCDSRSLLVLLKERQFERKNLHILGIGCAGVNESGNLSDSCTTCRQHNPVVYDEMVGDPATEIPANGADPVAEFDQLSPDQRWQALSEDISRCIRCYACRQACPNCYCPVCFVDANQPQPVGKTADLSENMSFHLMRAAHMAGRCVECGSCARACPMGIDLMKFNRKACRIVRDRFNAVAGMKEGDPPPLAAFDPLDGQEFIK